ncbi:plastocyanin/azurin family-domain-containing protein [Ostreococcus tauri]|uniref:Plastocyanin n=1 Tax=Ostreococcus tauri TaxID=70448 RepID=A0A1Y5IGN7_OSTTA|nr:plastocyanin/azurin family-domain-containing protein [Ostreococcus tauri]
MTWILRRKERQRTDVYKLVPNSQPSSLTISAGDTVEFVNNKAFPHNVVFDEDDVPSGVNADKLSHEDYLNAPGEKRKTTFNEKGTYGYYCEPHQGAGMAGKITVN